MLGLQVALPISFKTHIALLLMALVLFSNNNLHLLLKLWQLNFYLKHVDCFHICYLEQVLCIAFINVDFPPPGLLITNIFNLSLLPSDIDFF